MMNGAGYRQQGTNRSLNVGYLPGRKSVCVYYVDGSVMDVLAYCRSEEDGVKLIEWLDWLASCERFVVEV